MEDQRNEEGKPEEKKPPAPLLRVPPPQKGGAPAWALVPPNIALPSARPVFYLRFPSAMTDDPRIGKPVPSMTDEELKAFGSSDALFRQCIIWPVSVGDKKLAVQRAMGNEDRLQDELAKGMIRAVDGVAVDDSSANLDVWWESVGERVRSQLRIVWLQLHRPTLQEQQVFFELCIEGRSAG